MENLHEVCQNAVYVILLSDFCYNIFLAKLKIYLLFICLPVVVKG